MEKEYSQLHDFNYRKVDQLENSSYLEELTGLFKSVATKIEDGGNYFFKDGYYLNVGSDNNFNYFTDSFENSIYYGSSKSINIIQGSAGVGKTLFFKKGAQLLIRNSKDKTNYIYMGIDFKNIDNDQSIEYYEEWIYRRLKKRAVENVWRLGDEAFVEFNEAYQKFITGFEMVYTDLFPLKFFCEKIYIKYRKPCIIFFDNIDLASVETQKHIFAATVNVCDRFYEFMDMYGMSDFYRIYFAMRPETEYCYAEARVGEVIKFPLPNVLQISLAIIKKALTETAKEFDEEGGLSCGIICKNVISDEDEMKELKTFSQVADYFYEILDHYLANIWNDNPQIVERLGTSETFHGSIVNYNVRTFVRFLAHTIRNGGFKPFTREFNERYTTRYYSLYDYIEMLIRGRWTVHPGNLNINGEGNNKAPIIFNVFDTSIYGKKTEDKIKHFMLNIRILQYFFLCGRELEIRYEKMKKFFSSFFQEEYIEEATKKLIFVRFLYSYVQGDNIIATIKDYRDVRLEDAMTIKLSPVGEFYLKRMICEFEYLYQMAVTSLMCEEYTKELQKCWETEKEKTVLCFLKSVFEIIKENIKGYNEEQIIEFKKMFYDANDPFGSRPYGKMLNRFILVIRNKVQRAEKMKTGSVKKLIAIYEEAIALENEVKQYLESTFN